MKVTELPSEGLKRQFRVEIPLSIVKAHADKKLADLRQQLRVPGFRKGHAPKEYVESRYARSVYTESIEDIVNEYTQKVMADHGIKSALKPKVVIQQATINMDLDFTVEVETMPTIQIKPLKECELEKMVPILTDQDIEQEVITVLQNYPSKAPLKTPRKTREKDILEIAYVGTIGGKPFAGGSSDHTRIVLGEGMFLPEFEKALLGVNKGETIKTQVTFPKQYHAKNLAGKKADFSITVLEHYEPAPLSLNDDLAIDLGYDNLNSLKETVRNRLQNELDGMARLRLKRSLLDYLDAAYTFDIPEGMVDIEFQNIWAQAQKEAEESGEKIATNDEEDIKKDFRKIANRRVRLGLLLSEIGNQEKITISNEELTQEFMRVARQHGIPFRKLVKYVRDNPSFYATIRAPLFEEKVVDYLLDKINLKEKKVTQKELMDALDDEKMSVFDNKDDQKENSKKKSSAKKDTSETNEEKKPKTSKKKSDTSDDLTQKQTAEEEKPKKTVAKKK